MSIPPPSMSLRAVCLGCIQCDSCVLVLGGYERRLGGEPGGFSLCYPSYLLILMFIILAPLMPPRVTRAFAGLASSFSVGAMHGSLSLSSLSFVTLCWQLRVVLIHVGIKCQQVCICMCLFSLSR